VVAPPKNSAEFRHVGYRWKGLFNTYNFCKTHFFVKPIFKVGGRGVGVHVKIQQCGMPSCGVSLERFFQYLQLLYETLSS